MGDSVRSRLLAARKCSEGCKLQGPALDLRRVHVISRRGRQMTMETDRIQFQGLDDSGSRNNSNTTIAPR